jgi:VanZ family protein
MAMRWLWNNAHVRDRADERQQWGEEPGRPPVLRRQLVAALWVVSAAMIAYGTVGPIGLSGGPWFQMPAHWAWLPSVQDTNYNDIFTNFVVYLPLGAAARLTLRRRGRAGARDLLGAVAFAAAVSWATELFQQCIPARSASLMDVYVNAAGAAAGAWLAPGIQNVVRATHARMYTAWHTSPWIVLGWLTMALTAVLMTQPFRPAALHVDLTLLRTPDGIDFRRFAMFVLIGLIVTIGAAREREHLLAGVRVAMRRAAVLIVGLEAAQSVLAHHTCSSFDMLTGVAGGLVGTLAAIRLIESGRVPLRPVRPPLTEPDVLPWEASRWRPVAAVLLLILTVYVALPAVRAAGPPRMVLVPSVAGWPFHAHFYASFDRVIADVVESTLVFGAMALLCLFLRPDVGRGLGAGLLASLLALVAIGRWVWQSAPIDLTPPLLALGAWLAAGGLWRSLQPWLAPATPATDRAAR